ncbi:MAG TPA: tetratricopeptide repeat protein [Ktedonobacterales bacterium]|nr:tetratricopeptide repeat protein [Ktedonobacterales bacterium]
MGRNTYGGSDWDEGWEDDRGRHGSSPDNARRTRMSSSQINSALREAQTLQQEGHVGEAVAICEELLESGVDRADAHYFLGWLYQEADRWEDASSQFERLLDDPEYALSCFYALGQCARALGNVPEAAQYFDQAVDRVNLDALEQNESDQLLQLCQEAAEAHRDMNDIEGAQTIFSALLGYLRSQGWRTQIAEVERMQRETLGASSPAPRRNRTTGSAGRQLSQGIPQRAAASAGGGTGGPAGAGNLINAARPGVPPIPPQSMAAPSQSMAAPPQSAVESYEEPVRGPTWGDVGSGGGIGSGGASPDLGIEAPDRYSASGESALAHVLGAPPPLGGARPFLTGGMINDINNAAPGDQLAQIMSSIAGPQAGLRASLEFLPAAQRAQVAHAIQEIQNFIGHGLLTAAIEECMRVMEIAPQYLDIHVLLGEIYVRQGKIEQAIAKYVILAEQYLLAGRVDDTIATYRRILQLEPNNLPYRVKLIEQLSRQGRLDEVLTERMAAAEAYTRAGHAERAAQEYEQALLAWPNNVQVRLAYANALMKAGRAVQAVAEYQRILQTDPGMTLAIVHWQIALATGVGVSPALSSPGASLGKVGALDALGRLLRALRAENFRNYDDVVREYVMALDQHLGNADLRYSLGQIHLAAGRQQEAATAFQQIVSAPGYEILARYALGQTYLLAGDQTGAAQAVRELEDAAAAVRRTPPEPVVWAARPRLDTEERLAPEIEISTLLARAYQLSGQVAKMQVTLDAVSQNRARNDEIYSLIAEVAARRPDRAGQIQEYAQLARQYRASRQVENAILVLREMERLAPDDPAVRSELADIQVSRGQLEEGSAQLRALADIYIRRGALAEASQVYQRLSDIAWTAGGHDEALQLLRQAIQFATEDMALRHQFVQYCLEIGRNTDAAEQQTVIARYYFASRQSREAVAALQQLIAMDKMNFEAYDLLGQTYYSVGEYEQAARVYRNLARVDPTNQLARVRLQELASVRSQM